MEHLHTDSLTMHEVLYVHLFITQSSRGTCRIFHEIKKIQKINNTLTKEEKKTWNQLVNLGEPGAGPRLCWRREGTDANYPETRAGERLIWEAEWQVRSNTGKEELSLSCNRLDDSQAGGTKGGQQWTGGFTEKEMWEPSGVIDPWELGKPRWCMSCCWKFFKTGTA